METMYCYKCGKTILLHHNFCSFCGTKIDHSFLQRHTIEKSKIVNQKPIDFNDLFRKMEATLKEQSSLSDDEFEEHWGKFKKYHYKNDDDCEIYWKLVQVIFYSGMKAATVTARLPSIKNYFYDYKKVKEYSAEDLQIIHNVNEIIRHPKKIEACVKNAINYNYIITHYGFFSNYLESFGDLNNRDVLESLRNDLISRFDFLGNITAYHLMLDLGLKVWKPDRVICRILNRLGLLNDPNDIDRAVGLGREIAEQVDEPIRYIDIIFVKYGQKGNEKPFGLEDGICLERNPRCSICEIKKYCSFKQRQENH
jgi:DNA-3-methyladenine glycosylase I